MPVNFLTVNAAQSLLNRAGANDFYVFYGLSTAGITNKYNGFSQSFGYRQKESVRLNLSLNLGERFLQSKNFVGSLVFEKTASIRGFFVCIAGRKSPPSFGAIFCRRIIGF